MAEMNPKLNSNQPAWNMDSKGCFVFVKIRGMTGVFSTNLCRFVTRHRPEICQTLEVFKVPGLDVSKMKFKWSVWRSQLREKAEIHAWKQKMLKPWDFYGTLQLPEPCRSPSVCSRVVCQSFVRLFMGRRVWEPSRSSCRCLHLQGSGG